MCVFTWNENFEGSFTAEDIAVRMKKDLQGFFDGDRKWSESVSSISARNLKPGSFTIIAVPADLRSRSLFSFLTFHHKSALPFFLLIYSFISRLVRANSILLSNALHF